MKLSNIPESNLFDIIVGLSPDHQSHPITVNVAIKKYFDIVSYQFHHSGIIFQVCFKNRENDEINTSLEFF